MHVPGPGGKDPDDEKTSQEPASKEPAPRGKGAKTGVVVLLLVCIGLAIGLVFTVRDAAGARKRLELGNEIGALYLNGIIQLEADNYAGARESFEKALARAREYQSEGQDSYVEALSKEIKSILKQPAIARGESGMRAQKRAELKKLIRELKPADIYVQLGDKAPDILDEHVKHMRPEDIAALVPEHVEKLADKRISELDEKELTQRLSKRLDSILQKRLAGMTVIGLRTWLQKRLEDLVRSEIERRKYDPSAMSELLGDRREDIVRSFIGSSKAERIAELLEERFDEIERVMAKKMLACQERITLDDGKVWEGQVLHDGPLSIRFLRNDGRTWTIPKSKIKKREKLLQPKDGEKQPEKPKEPEDDPGPGDSEPPPDK
jgi:hypothetical protein